MKKVTVIKQAGDGRPRRFTVPLSFISQLTTLLPRGALAELKAQGISLGEIVAAAKNDAAYSVTLRLVEHGQPVTVTLSTGKASSRRWP